MTHLAGFETLKAVFIVLCGAIDLLAFGVTLRKILTLYTAMLKCSQEESDSAVWPLIKASEAEAEIVLFLFLAFAKA